MMITPERIRRAVIIVVRRGLRYTGGVDRLGPVETGYSSVDQFNGGALRAVAIYTMDLKNMLSEISPDRRNLHGDGPSQWTFGHRHNLAERCRERGASTASGHTLTENNLRH